MQGQGRHGLPVDGELEGLTFQHQTVCRLNLKGQLASL